jgi:DNA polymerase III alpha subunit
MSIPYFVFSDHSYEQGGNTVKENVLSAKECGLKSLGVIDYSSAAGMVQFIKNCRNQGITPLHGATLLISDPCRDSFLWERKNSLALDKISETLNLPHGTVLTREKSLSLIELILKTHKSKAKGKFDVFNKYLLDEFSCETAISSAELLKELNVLCKLIVLKVSHGRLTFVAQNEAGYKALLRLVSIEAINESELKLSGMDSKSVSNSVIAATLDDVLAENDIFVVDPLRSDTYLGALISLNVSIDDLEPYVGALVNANAYCGIGIMPNSKVEHFLLSNQTLGQIPFPLAAFVRESGFEDFRIKSAVHRGINVNSVTFETIASQHDYMRGYDHLVSEYDNLRDTYPRMDIMFWAEKEPVNIVLDVYKLPNYDMNKNDVIRYFFSTMGVDLAEMSDVEASDLFSEWIVDNCPKEKGIAEFKEATLNAMCLHQLSLDGVNKKLKLDHGDKYEELLPDYIKRHKFEFDVIEGMGFSGYFLIEYDIVSYARKIGVPVGDARGSGAGSLIVYGLDITDVDPIEYDLQFERFLNPERVSMPDIDVDFGDGGEKDRTDVLNYISEKYKKPGSRYPSSGQIANVNCYKVKSSISVVCKAFGLTMAYERYVSSLIKKLEAELGKNDIDTISFDDILESDLFRVKFTSEPVLKKVLDKSIVLYGKKSTTGVHAGGVVISPTTLTDFTSVVCGPDGNFISEFDKDDVETAGLVKFDCLGLKTLTVLAETDRQIFRNHGVKINQRAIDKNDPEVYALINRMVLQDIFQMSSLGMRDLVSRLNPLNNIGDLAVLSALFRPGALQSGMTDDYVNTKNGSKKLSYDHPALIDVTKDTFGCIVYQEQVMSIVRELAGYTLGEADQLRRAMGKKKIEEMTRHKKIYNQRAQEHWRDDYLQKGKKASLPFPLDVCLTDIVEAHSKLNLGEATVKGYFAEGSLVLNFMASISTLNDDAKKALNQRLLANDYTVQLFKEHYQEIVYLGVEKALGEIENIDEVKQRIYFGLSQFVRFNQIFNKIEKFASYGFNKSHAVGYALVTYKTAWRKTHYTSEYYAAAMTFAKTDIISLLVVEAKTKMNVKLLPPNVNKSEDKFRAETVDSVRYGLGALKSVGAFGKYIELERELNGEFQSYYEFMLRVSCYADKKLNSGALESLAMVGALDQFIPETIKKNKQVNGRHFIFWLGKTCMASSVFKLDLEQSKGNGSVLDAPYDLTTHRQLVSMSDEALFSYIMTMMTPGKIVIFLNLIDSEFDENKNVIENDCTDIALLKTKINTEVFESSKDYLFESGYETELSHVKLATSTMIKRYVVFYNLVVQNSQFVGYWYDALVQRFDKSIVDVLNAERDISGLYMTMSPLNAIKAHDMLDREPPSSIVDGCPLRISDLPECLDEERVMTVGIVRDLSSRQVKDEDSKWFNEKFLNFTIEDNNDKFKCKVFGSAATNMLFDKLLQDGTIAVVIGDVQHSDKYGSSISVTAVKIYHPEPSGKIVVLPRAGRR